MKIHLVKKGETLFHIAKKYGIELQKLITFNSQLADPNQIDVGMKIKIPSSGSVTPPPSGAILHKHVVVQGDSLWKLAKAWNVPLKAVIDANPHLKNPNVLMTGDIVYIPNLHANEAAEEGAHDQGGHHVIEGAYENMMAEHHESVENQVVENVHENVVNQVVEQAHENVEHAEVKPVEEAPKAPELLPVQEAPKAPELLLPIQEAPVMPIAKEKAEAKEMPHPFLSPMTKEHETQFPFMPFQMPAVEAVQPYSLQPAQFEPHHPGKGKSEEMMPPAPVPFYFHGPGPMMPQAPMMQPMAQPMMQQPMMEQPMMEQPMNQPMVQSMMQPMNQPIPQPLPYFPVAEAEHAPSKFDGPEMHPMAQVSPAMQFPAMHEQYPGIPQAAAAPCADWDWPGAVSPFSAEQMPMFPNQPFPVMGVSGGPCLPCQGHGVSPMGMYGMPYALPTSVNPAELSPHAALMQQQDCGCDGRDERTGDLTLQPVVMAQEPERSDKTRDGKAAVSLRPKAPKRRTPPEKRAKKQNSPWIRR